MTNRTFMTVAEVAAELGVSKSYAYKIVKQLNEEFVGFHPVLEKAILPGEERIYNAAKALLEY